MNRRYSIVLLISIVVIIAVYSFTGGGVKPELDIGEDRLSVAYQDFSATVEYENVSAIEVVEVSDFGESVSGGSDRSCRWGLWENEEFGEYSQYSLMNTDCAVLMHLRDGGLFLLSYESGETTALLGEVLHEMLTTQGYEVEYIS